MATPDFIVGILGNVISVLLCASPMGMFWELTKTKSAENYNALPYISQLLCKSLWTFYGILDPNGLLIVTVNSVGVVSQVIYVFIYLIYAPKDKKVKALVFVAILNIAFPGSVIVVTLLAFHGSARRTFIGIFCAAVTVAMYAAPLSVMRTVIMTKSVEYMPFFLSLFLLLNAGCWFTFALLLKDHYVIVANAIGIVSGSAQLIIYMIYKDKSSLVESEKTEVKEASIHKLEEGIKAQDMNEFDEGKLKSRSASLPKPSISRAYTINKLMRTVSMSQYESHSAFLLVP